MEHFGFVVPVPLKPGHDAQYIVPALLRDKPQQLPPDAPQLVLHFELAERSASKGDLLLKSEALQQGFLPEGAVHHLFGMAVGWTYHTAPGFEPTLGSNSASVAFGSLQLVLQRTSLERFSIRCTIRKVARSSIGAALPVADRLRLLVSRVLERFPTLICRVLLPLPSAPDHLIDRAALMAESDTTIYVRNQPMPIATVRQELCAFLRPPQPPGSFEGFFSHSHNGAFDSPFIEKVYDATTADGTVAFLDQYALRSGEDLAFSCMLGIANSRVLVPLITWPALRRLSVLTTGSECSYYLLELTFGVLLHELRQRPVFPIFVGASDQDGAVDVTRDLFAGRPPRASDDGLANAVDPTTSKPLPDDRRQVHTPLTFASRTCRTRSMDTLATAYNNLLYLPHSPHSPHLPHSPHSPHSPHLPYLPHLPHLPCLPHFPYLPWMFTAAWLSAASLIACRTPPSKR